jgi:replication-associated recombination protein RarA
VSLTNDLKQSIWAERFRPQSVAEMVLPPRMMTAFEKMVAGDMPHLLLYAPESGVGKTTVALIIAKALAGDSVLYINASSENSVDTVRNNITDFAETMSLTGTGLKVCVLDECERMGGDNAQAALRALLERSADNCRFILTTNYIAKIIPAIRSRCSEFDFQQEFRDAGDELKVKFVKRVTAVLESEGISYDRPVVLRLVEKAWPDMRRIWNVLQAAASKGPIDSSTVTERASLAEELLDIIATGHFTNIRKFVAENIGQNTTYLYGALFDAVAKWNDPAASFFVAHLAEAQYRDAFAADKEVNLMGFVGALFRDQLIPLKRA